MPLRKKVLIVTAASFAAILGAVLTTAAIVRDAAADPPQAEPFSLTPLPYAEGALVPYISAETVSYHYHKHYQGYVNNLSKLTAGEPSGDLAAAMRRASPSGPARPRYVLLEDRTLDRFPARALVPCRGRSAIL